MAIYEFDNSVETGSQKRKRTTLQKRPLSSKTYEYSSAVRQQKICSCKTYASCSTGL